MDAAMADERRVRLCGLPFLMNEAWLRHVLHSEDIKRPWKVVLLRKGEHKSWSQWQNAFIFYETQAEAIQVARLLDNYQLQGWWRRLTAELARPDEQRWKLGLQCFQWLSLKSQISFIILDGCFHIFRNLFVCFWMLVGAILAPGFNKGISSEEHRENSAHDISFPTPKDWAKHRSSTSKQANHQWASRPRRLQETCLQGFKVFFQSMLFVPMLNHIMSTYISWACRVVSYLNGFAHVALALTSKYIGELCGCGPVVMNIVRLFVK